MRLSTAITKTRKTAPKDAESANARLLIQAGFIEQISAGIYAYLPLGLKVLNKISNVVRREMNATGAEEVLLTALQPKNLWDATDRWDGFDVLYRVTDSSKRQFAIGPSAEEVVTPVVQQFVKSYKDLPKAVYQIQTKFRDEPRPKSGLLRGREFLMKDLYSFHTDTSDLETYYEEMIQAYLRVYEGLGFKDARLVEASGGAFSKLSDEFQVFCPTGEDTIYYCDACEYAVNDEIAEVKEGDKCPRCKSGSIKTTRSIEVGNIFKLGDKFTKAFNFSYTDPAGKQHPIVMGCYGLGISRVMGALVEVFHDDDGIVWPKQVAPADIHIVTIGSDEAVSQTADKLYSLLSDSGKDVIYDDREESAGVKFADADLIGVPLRITVSPKTIEKASVELKQRDEAESNLVKLSDIQSAIN